MNAFTRCIAKYLVLFALFASCCGAFAAEIVTPGSTYNVVLFGSGGTTYLTNVVFDDFAQTFTRNVAGQTSNLLSVTESQTDLGNGSYQISFSIKGTGDIFPYAASGYNGNGYVQIGANNNPFDLLETVKVDATSMRFVGPNIDYNASVLNFYDQPNPWNGAFPSLNFGGGFVGIGGMGVNQIDVEITVSRLPEPSTFALFG